MISQTSQQACLLPWSTLARQCAITWCTECVFRWARRPLISSMAVVCGLGSKDVLSTLWEAAWRPWSYHGLQKLPELPTGSASHGLIVVEEPAQPPAPSGVEACWGLALLAKMLCLFSVVCNGLPALREPFHPPKGWDAGGNNSGERAFLHVSGECYNVHFQPLQFILHPVHYFQRTKKSWKVFKTRERLALRCGEVTKQGDKHLGRLCQGCLWLGLGAEPEALEMVTTLFSPCFLFPLQWKNSFFYLAPSFTSACGLWQADESVAEWFLWASLPCRGDPTAPMECVLWVLTPSQHLLLTGSLSSLCRHLGKSVTQYCCARGPSSFRAFCQQFPSPSLQFRSSCSFTCFFHLCSYWKNAKQMKLTCFPQIERWLTNTSSCQAGAHIKDDTSVERSCYCCWLVHIFSIFPCD